MYRQNDNSKSEEQRRIDEAFRNITSPYEDHNAYEAGPRDYTLAEEPEMEGYGTVEDYKSQVTAEVVSTANIILTVFTVTLIVPVLLYRYQIIDSSITIGILALQLLVLALTWFSKSTGRKVSREANGQINNTTDDGAVL